MNTRINTDESRALGATIFVAAGLVIFSLIYTIDMGRNLRPSFIEVEFGDFQTGTLAEFSEVQNEEVATRPDPADTPTDDPVEEAPEPEVKPEQTAQENVKPVDLPDQVEEVVEEEVKTPETEVIDPNQTSEQKAEEQVVIPPQAKEDMSTEEGAQESGDVDGAKGELNADQGIGNDDEKTSPYELKWEGDIERATMAQPMPENSSNEEAVITMRFEVRPDGTVNRIIPLKKMSPELEAEVMRTLRSWRFSRLPGGVPQQAQWGTITFRFVFN